jgi:hypothetical protein
VAVLGVVNDIATWTPYQQAGGGECHPACGVDERGGGRYQRPQRARDGACGEVAGALRAASKPKAKPRMLSGAR